MGDPARGSSPPRKRPRVAFNPGLLASPFYAGPTAYGGAAAAAASPHARLPPLYRRPARAPRPAPAAPAPLSRAAQRIADLLRHVESPLADVRRRERSGAAPAPGPAPPRRELRAPALAALLRLKQRNRCVAGAQAALAASLSSSAPYQPTDYSLPKPAAPGAGKLRPRLSSQRRRDPDELPEPVHLPGRALQLPGGRLPAIDLGLPPPPPPKPTKRFIFRDPLDGKTHPRPEPEPVKPRPSPTPAAKSPSPEKSLPLPALSTSTAATPTATTTTVPEDSSSLKKFLKKPTQWECDSCLSTNDSDKNKCVCCEAPKPGAKKDPLPATKLPALVSFQPPTNDTSGLSGFLEKQRSQWECSCCMTRNEADKNKCVCCEAAKPGTESGAAKSSGFNFGSTPNGGFKFGIDKANDPPETKLGSEKKETSTAAKSALPPGGFVFGAPPPTTAKPSELKFGMTNGDATTSSKPKPPEPTLGLPLVNGDAAGPEKAPAPTFSFGIDRAKRDAPPETTAAEVPVPIPAAPQFSFSSTPPVQTKTKTEVVKTAPVFSASETFSPKTETTKPVAASPPTAPSAPTVPASLFSFSGDSGAGPAPIKFNFGSPQPPEKPASESSFGTPAPAVFSFGAPTPAKSLFSSTSASSVAPLSEAPSQFSSAGSATEKPKTAVPAAPFAFKPSTPKVNPFESPSSTSPFAFGLPSSMSKPEPPKPTTFGSGTATTSIFGAPTVNGGLPDSKTFGSASSSIDIFASKPTAAAPSPSLFGNPTTAESKTPAFGGPPTSPVRVFGSNAFGGRPPAANSFGSNGAFGGPRPPTADGAGSNLFGVRSPNKVLTDGPGMFGGDPARPTNVFGSSAPPAAPVAGVFGSAGASPNPGAVFGSAGTQAVRPAGVFGSSGASTAPAAGVFGSSGVSGAGVFGSSAPSFGTSLPFGDAGARGPPPAQFKFGEVNPIQTVVGAFGRPPAPAGTASPFSFGAPTAAAPMSSQFNFSMGANSPVARPGAGGNASVPARRYKRAVRRNNLPQ